MHEALDVLTCASLSQVGNETPFLDIKVRFGAERGVRGNNRLVVAAEDILFLLLDGQLCDVSFGGLPSVLTPGGRRAPQHSVWILGVRSDKSDVRGANILIEAVHSILQVGGVLLVPFGRLVGPELTGLL